MYVYINEYFKQYLWFWFNKEMYIFTNFLCIDCPAKYKNFGQTQQQVTRSLCNLGKRGYRINYMHIVGLLSSVNNVTCDCTVCIMFELVNYLEEDLSNFLWSCFKFSHSELSCLWYEVNQKSLHNIKKFSFSL